MDPVVRRKIPACVRSLLTDIAPKEEQHLSDWSETDPETITKDGMALPKRGTSETLLTPADGTDGAPSDSNVATSLKPCGLCLSKPSCYTCPRCNIPYCGLTCYQSPDHSGCSEEFYKESVFLELKSQGVTDEEGKSKMQEILLRLRQSAQSEGGMENLFMNLQEETGTNVTGQDTHALELLSRLAELQSAGETKSQEAQEILTKLQDIDVTDGSDEGVDLAEKLAGLDVDSLSEEQLWSLLSAQEKEKFEGLVKGGSIGGLVVLWSPWWERHEKETKALIVEMKSENDGKMLSVNEKKDGLTKTSVENIKEGTGKVKSELGTKQELIKKKEASKKDRSKSDVPPISAKISSLHTLSSNPSPLVRYNLVNALYGYTFSLCLFNGDISEPEIVLEFCLGVLAISEALGGGRVFRSVPEAIEAGITAVSAGGYFDSDDPSAPLRAVEAVAHVLAGESREDTIGYSLSALSQMRAALNKAKASVAKEDKKMRQMYFQAWKKCEFFQSWVKESPKVVRDLAGWVWRDYERREVERMQLQREKKGLEEGMKTCRGKAMLIEEIE
ncbi:zinc finger HIT domain-containing protein 2 [Xyrauchen texanus]|uniref:zinc finger HIT domain-containing protein 2 n=1 Tax=Xyrauchen texanus TaxID=154827 RepID=UPI00224215FF|nr:zinc finger HIT domain-containing protein 2 [Xyrauchen texanus]XP_051972324.1 zinc finger HIT domain-containing protein 2 [Xyrauchen texanus]XP_051972325.1 zinc finger HIT domain-containing protein 2 [Xyrauchen texanus]XP_051972326.1 zinc finger HIT domain-containing protein 2 [Xyrauchen texanus]